MTTPAAFWSTAGSYVYYGQQQPGDSAATTDQIAAFQANIPPNLSAGLAVISTGTSALNGTYPIDFATQLLICGELTIIQTTTTLGTPLFSNGNTTRACPDISGGLHTFTIAQFIQFGLAIAKYIDAYQVGVVTAQLGGTPTWPSSPVTIP